jgi:hypothetical protein
LYRSQIPNSRWVWLTPSTKAAFCQDLALGIEQHLIRISSQSKDLLLELNTYECDYNGYIYNYHGPQGGHGDDCVIALALAWRYAWRGASVAQQSPGQTLAALIG